MDQRSGGEREDARLFRALLAAAAASASASARFYSISGHGRPGRLGGCRGAPGMRAGDGRR